MRSVSPNVRGLICALVATGTLGSKCVTYDPALDASHTTDDSVTDDGDSGQTCTAQEPVYTVEAMRADACVGLRCTSQKVALFWEDVWEDYETIRVLRVTDTGYVITDKDGASADLSYAQGLPATLIIRNSGQSDTTQSYDVTAPILFRHIAWSHIETTDGAYEASTFDAVAPLYTAGVTHDMVLHFVPIEPGTFDLYSSGGVTNGSDYSAIADGSELPDLSTGQAGAGLKTTLTVTGPSALTLFTGYDVDRDSALDTDPRREDGDAVWADAAVTTIIIDADESTDEETGADIFKFVWSSLTLQANVGHVIDLRSSVNNNFQHNFTALGLLRNSIMRELADSQGVVRASYIESTNIIAGKEVLIYIVPTTAARYNVYCQLGVVFSPNGQPDMQTGHAGAGMHDTVQVTP